MENTNWLVWQGHHSLRIKTSLISHLPPLLITEDKDQLRSKLHTLSKTTGKKLQNNKTTATEQNNHISQPSATVRNPLTSTYLLPL